MARNKLGNATDYCYSDILKMAQRFVISIDESGWTIEKEGIKTPYNLYEEAKSPIGIGVCRKSKDGIVVMYDPFAPTDELIKECEKYEGFLEKGSFVVLKGEKREKADSFEGTIIDALKYIKGHFGEYRG